MTQQASRSIQFTEWMDTEKGCREWYQWFKERGVPTAIIQLKNSKGIKHAVYRNWKGNPRMDVGSIVNLSVVDACNGFL